jgi:hypothetical protein
MPGMGRAELLTFGQLPRHTEQEPELRRILIRGLPENLFGR